MCVASLEATHFLLGEIFMKITFCGHFHIPQEYMIDDYVYEEIIKAINNGADTFYVTTFGKFNAIALRTLKRFKKEKFPHITIIGISPIMDIPVHIANSCDEIIEIPNAKEGDLYNRRCLKAMKYAADCSDGVICFVTNFISMSFLIYNYIKKKNKIIVNLKDRYEHYFE